MTKLDFLAICGNEAEWVGGLLNRTRGRLRSLRSLLLTGGLVGSISEEGRGGWGGNEGKEGNREEPVIRPLDYLLFWVANSGGWH